MEIQISWLGFVKEIWKSPKLLSLKRRQLLSFLIRGEKKNPQQKTTQTNPE